MTVLSRQTIIEYMGRDDDPLKVYTEENGKEIPIPLDQINSHTVNLSIGTEVAELDMNRLVEEITLDNPKDVPNFNIMDFRGYGGINPYEHREAIKKSTRLLDLSKLDDYIVVKEAQSDFGKCYSWVVSTKDDKYQFQTRITKENDEDTTASGIILHPVSYDYMLRYVHAMESSRKVLDHDKRLIELAQARLENTKVNKNVLKSELELLLRENKAISNSLRFHTYSSPSASFSDIYTKEFVRLPNDVSGVLQTKSKMARLGISSHPSSGKVDAGYDGSLVLEYKNIGNIPIELKIGNAVAELEFHKLDKPTNMGYSERKDSLYKKNKLGF
ncbi:MAG: hypothetical protein JW700_03810 [Candidatus Aenigmarchaeota archaeon]|nr:hypothetical protein [Candidatus Aenigmarchaeota archaeon]